MDQIVDQPDVLLERLLFVMGKGDASAAERAKLARNLRITERPCTNNRYGESQLSSWGVKRSTQSVNCCRNYSLRKPRCGTYETSLVTEGTTSTSPGYFA